MFSKFQLHCLLQAYHNWLQQRGVKEYALPGLQYTNEQLFFIGYAQVSRLHVYIIQLFRERLSDKSTKVHATRPKGGQGIHKNFAYWPREMYKFVFLNAKKSFSSQEVFFCSLTSTVACIEFSKFF